MTPKEAFERLHFNKYDLEEYAKKVEAFIE